MPMSEENPFINWTGRVDIELVRHIYEENSAQLNHYFERGYGQMTVKMG